ncbi:MAG TPA: hypothetical protein VM097_12170 [Mycobacteriales bacterium]|nr:hypothetical protein [Mycobacteriales bacterium]
MRRLTRPGAALAAVTTVVALAGPAMAASVDVTVVGLGGTRQFNVEDLSGATLTALDLGTGQAKPFRTHVTDAGFLPVSAVTDDYSVTATLSNLYLKTGASTYNYAVKIPSSALGIDFGATPLAGTGISLQDLPQLSLTGTMSNCLGLTGPLKTALGLGTSGLLNGLPLDPSNTALSTLCTTLLTTQSVTATVDGVVQNLVPTLSSVLDLPSQLGGATGGTFTNASYSAGTVGAGDTAGAAGAPTATAVSLMTGTHNLSSGLITALSSALTSALSGLPIVSTAVTPTKTTIDSVVAGLGTAANGLSNQLSAVLATLSETNQATVINGLGLSATPLAPVLADIKGITGSYYAFPILTAAPNNPVAGTYGGTMTVTFVQS